MLSGAVLAPMLMASLDEPVEGSRAFQVRSLVSALAALFMLFGLAQGVEAETRFANFANGAAFIGTALLFAHEWAQLVIIHPIALAAPEALELLENAEGPMDLFDCGAIAAFLTFALGWIAKGIALMAQRGRARLAGASIIAGLALPSFLAVAITPSLVQIGGTCVLALGLFLLATLGKRRPQQPQETEQ